jgi:hypothetical protein
MSDASTSLSHDEISLLLFALQGGVAAPPPDPESCEDACPVSESMEELFCGGRIDSEQQLVRHLNNHVREALIESGVFELMGAARESAVLSSEQQSKLNDANRRLKQYRSSVRFSPNEREMLIRALSRVPRSAWLVMPRTMWRLKKKLRRD